LTTRDRLDRLRDSTRAFRDAVRREAMADAAARDARGSREAAARNLADDLRGADIPEGLGFEHGGIVVWWEGYPKHREALGHVFLAYYRGQA
jgi:hypothetical protein